MRRRVPHQGRPTAETTNIRLVRWLYGPAPAIAFGSLALKTVRNEMMRAGNCRTEIKRCVGRVGRMFRRGVAEELVPPGDFEALWTVAGLRTGRSAVREKPPVGPVPDADVEAIRPRVGRQVRAMIDIQNLTGMRPGEVILLRTADCVRDGDVWINSPSRHKTEHHGKVWQVFIGPRGQELLRPWLRAEGGSFLFSPAEAMKERRADRGSRVQPSQADRSKARPARSPGARCTEASYRRAIRAACLAAGVSGWHPRQLRHSAATGICKRFGLEASRFILGPEDARAMQIYAEEDRSRGIEVMRQIGLTVL